MKNLIIIGAGPAGVSAALYAQRGGIETAVLANTTGALGKTEKIENYYGFAEPISGAELFENGVAGAKRLGISFFNEEAVSIEYDGNFSVATDRGMHKAGAVLLATGKKRLAPPVSGLAGLEGKGVSYCAVCDAFFYRGKHVCVLGSGEYALHEAQTLLPIAASVAILTNGEPPSAAFPDSLRIIEKKLKAFTGTQRLEKAVFDDDTAYETDGLFIAYGTAGTTAFARKLGAAVDGETIRVNENMQTSVSGLYAAGDCTGGLLQISKAVYEGAKAGTEIIKYLRSKEN